MEVINWSEEGDCADACRHGVIFDCVSIMGCTASSVEEKNTTVWVRCRAATWKGPPKGEEDRPTVFLCTKPLHAKCQRINISFQAMDHGHGDMKGKIYLRLVRQGRVLQEQELALAGYSWKKVRKTISGLESLVKMSEMGDHYEFLRYVGGGGGRTLNVRRFVAGFNFLTPLPDKVFFPNVFHFNLSNASYDGEKHDTPVVLFTSPRVRTHVRSIIFSAKVKDQGLGAATGKITLLLKRGNAVVTSIDVAKAEHEWKTRPIIFRKHDPIVQSAQAGDNYELTRFVGGGGGHQLFIQDLSLVIHCSRHQHHNHHKHSPCGCKQLIQPQAVWMKCEERSHHQYASPTVFISHKLPGSVRAVYFSAEIRFIPSGVHAGEKAQLWIKHCRDHDVISEQCILPNISLEWKKHKFLVTKTNVTNGVEPNDYYRLVVVDNSHIVKFKNFVMGIDCATPGSWPILPIKKKLRGTEELKDSVYDAAFEYEKGMSVKDYDWDADEGETWSEDEGEYAEEEMGNGAEAVDDDSSESSSEDGEEEDEWCDVGDGCTGVTSGWEVTTAAEGAGNDIAWGFDGSGVWGSDGGYGGEIRSS